MPSRPGAALFHQHLRAGEWTMKSRVSGDGSCLSKGFSVPWNCTECLLWLFLLPPFFLLTLPIRLSESPDSTGKQQMLTLLLPSQRQLPPVGQGARRKVRDREWRKVTSPFPNCEGEDLEGIRKESGTWAKILDSWGYGKKGPSVGCGTSTMRRKAEGGRVPGVGVSPSCLR